MGLQKRICYIATISYISVWGCLDLGNCILKKYLLMIFMSMSLLMVLVIFKFLKRLVHSKDNGYPWNSFKPWLVSIFKSTFLSPFLKTTSMFMNLPVDPLASTSSGSTSQ